jgi:hypothetical protein
VRHASGALDCVWGLWYNAPTRLPAGSLEAEFRRFQATGRQRTVVGALYHKL